MQIRLTGDVPLSDEEFATLTDRAWLMGGAMMAGVLATLWLALRSFKIILAILITLVVGLALTMGLGLIFIGVFNIISIAFIALFVGLGVDFGIQFSVRYRAERFQYPQLSKALCHTGRSVGLPLALAAAATAVGFFSFLPTNYIGVAELGFVAGLGMVIAFFTSITLLPALLMLLSAGRRQPRMSASVSLAVLDDILARHRRAVLRIAVGAGLVCLGLVFFLRFDSNPLDLRSPKVESVSTLFDLMNNPQTSPNTINVTAPSLANANALEARLSKLPKIAQTLTLSSFIPEDQDKKLALIADANGLLDSTLNPFDVKPAPSDAEIVTSFKSTAAKLREAAKDQTDGPASHARTLADALDALAGGAPENRARAAEAVVPTLKTMLRQLSNALTPAHVSLETMPAAMKAEWIAANGTARIQVFPKDTSNDPGKLSEFTDEVMTVAPDATGAPISIRESGRKICVARLCRSGNSSFITIVVLLAAVLRRTADVVMTLAPLILAGLLTMGTCVVLNMQLNFANIIALPLLLGIGVAFNIYFVVAWRAGAKNFLQSSLTRAVIFSAATTASGFGTLWLSRHPGTASMGELLMISLFWTLVSTLFVSPALLGPPPAREDRAHEKLI